MSDRDPTERRLELVRELLKGAPPAVKLDTITSWAPGEQRWPDGTVVKGEPFLMRGEAKTLLDEAAEERSPFFGLDRTVRSSITVRTTHDKRRTLRMRLVDGWRAFVHAFKWGPDA